MLPPDKTGHGKRHTGEIKDYLILVLIVVALALGATVAFFPRTQVQTVEVSVGKDWADRIVTAVVEKRVLVPVEATREIPVTRVVEVPVIEEKVKYIDRERPVKTDVEVHVVISAIPTWTPFTGYRKFEGCGDYYGRETLTCRNLYLEAGRYKVIPNCTSSDLNTWSLRFRDHQYGYWHNLKGVVGDPAPIYQVVDKPPLDHYPALGFPVNNGGEIFSGVKRVVGSKECVFKIERLGD